MTRGLAVLVALSLAAAGCGSGGDAVMDCFSIGRYKRLVQPSFDLYTMNVKTKEGTRVDVYLQMQFEHLRFVKADNGYASAYSVLFVIRDNDDAVVQTREISRTVNVGSYEQSVSLDADAFMQSFVLAPGSYRFSCTSTDQNSQVKYAIRRKLEVRAFDAAGTTTSDMLLLLKPKSTEKGLVLHPLFPQTLWYARDSMGIFQELYNVHTGDTIEAVLRYAQQAIAAKDTSHADVTMSPPYISTTIPCGREFNQLVLTDSLVYGVPDSGTVPFVHYYPLPPPGYSKLELTFHILHGGTVDQSKASMTLFRQKQLHAGPDEIIEAMRFIAHDDEIDRIKAAGDTGRVRAVERFWADRGGAVRQAEFDGRVDEADRLFTVCIEGSRTPMGITYIVCGPPDGVDCRNPYSETWLYTVDTQTMIVPFRILHRDDDLPYYELQAFTVNDQLWRSFIDRWRRQ